LYDVTWNISSQVVEKGVNLKQSEYNFRSRKRELRPLGPTTAQDLF